MRTLDSHLLGCPVSDYATGQLLGWVKAVDGGVCSSSIASIIVDRQREDAFFEASPFDLPEVEPHPHHDYMIGQIATVTLTEPSGQVIIAEGDLITCQVLHHARRCGFLHRLSATFRHR